jgi:hypothetical protein
MELTIEAREHASGNAKTNSAQRARQSVPRKAAGAPPIGIADPTANVAIPGRSASHRYRRNWGSRYGWVDGIVTLGTIVGFAVMLALMTGEWLLAPTANLTQLVVAKAAPAATPTVVAGPPIEPHADPRPL